MLNALQFERLIVEPVLRGLTLYSPEAAALMLGTCGVESLGGTFLEQVNGPALGIYQLEPNAHEDIWNNYLPRYPIVCSKLMTVCGFSRRPTSQQLVHNLYYATAMTRIFYERVKEPIPKKLEDIADYYKKYYNTEKGKSTPEEFIEKYKLFTGKDSA